MRYKHGFNCLFLFIQKPDDDIECDDLVLPFAGLFPEGDENLKVRFF